MHMTGVELLRRAHVAEGIRAALKRPDRPVGARQTYTHVPIAVFNPPLHLARYRTTAQQRRHFQLSSGADPRAGVRATVRAGRPVPTGERPTLALAG